MLKLRLGALWCCFASRATLDFCNMARAARGTHLNNRTSCSEECATRSVSRGVCATRPIQSRNNYFKCNRSINNCMKVKQRSWNCAVTFSYTYCISCTTSSKAIPLVLGHHCLNSSIYCLGRKSHQVQGFWSSGMNGCGAVLMSQWAHTMTNAASIITA